MYFNKANKIFKESWNNLCNKVCKKADKYSDSSVPIALENKKVLN